jgi:hypothetical protein
MRELKASGDNLIITLALQPCFNSFSWPSILLPKWIDSEHHILLLYPPGGGSALV